MKGYFQTNIKKCRQKHAVIYNNIVHVRLTEVGVSDTLIFFRCDKSDLFLIHAAVSSIYYKTDAKLSVFSC